MGFYSLLLLRVNIGGTNGEPPSEASRKGGPDHPASCDGLLVMCPCLSLCKKLRSSRSESLVHDLK